VAGRVRRESLWPWRAAMKLGGTRWPNLWCGWLVAGEDQVCSLFYNLPNHGGLCLLFLTKFRPPCPARLHRQFSVPAWPHLFVSGQLPPFSFLRAKSRSPSQENKTCSWHLVLGMATKITSYGRVR
jgi:hypothetical protein